MTEAFDKRLAGLLAFVGEDVQLGGDVGTRLRQPDRALEADSAIKALRRGWFGEAATCGGCGSGEGPKPRAAFPSLAPGEANG